MRKPETYRWNMRKPETRKANDMSLKCLLIAIFVFGHMMVMGQPTVEEQNKSVLRSNRVRNQESWDYRYDGDKVGRSGSMTSVTTYTATGDVSQVVTYNPKGEVMNIETYAYDAQGNRTEYTRLDGENAEKPAYQKLTSYNAEGNVAEENGFDGVEHFRNLYTYTREGELAEIQYYNGSRIREKRKFSREGDVTTVMVYNAAGGLVSKILLRYDHNGNLLEESVYGMSEDALEKKLYDYDENQNLKEESKYRLDKIVQTTTYTYNAAGDMLEIYEQGQDAARFLKRGFVYDAAGRLSEIRWRRNSSEEFNRLVYSYDQKGICTTVDTFYPATDYRVLTKYIYAFY